MEAAEASSPSAEGEIILGVSLWANCEAICGELASLELFSLRLRLAKRKATMKFIHFHELFFF